MEKVIDHFGGNEIKRPIENPTLKYDFDFRRIGDTTWRYINSSNDLDAFREQIVAVVSNKGEYRIVDNKTGKIV